MQLKGISSEAAPAKMFDGRFFLSNPYDFDKVCKWGGVEYEFKAMTTSPLMIESANPLETQEIRMKFAVDIGTEAFMRSSEYKRLSGMEQKTKGMGVPTYVAVMKTDNTGRKILNSESPIAPFVIKCLEPLPIVPIKATRRKREDTPLRTDPKTGKPVITLMSHEEQDNRSLVGEAANG